MKFNQLNGFAFDKGTKTLGAIASVDFLKQTMTILTDDDDKVIAKLGDVTFLEQVGTIGSTGIINHDVVTDASGKMFEIELLEDGETVQIHLIDEKLERIDTGQKFNKADIGQLEPFVTLLGNINILEPVEDKVVDFNIKIVRGDLGDGIQYFYACNNAELEEVDLIKVVFIGHQLLEEEKYERLTFDHEDYLAFVESGDLVETTPQNLMNYVTGLTYGNSSGTYGTLNKVSEEQELEDEFDEDFDIFEEDIEEDSEDEDYCECGCYVEDCECEDW